MEYFRFHKAYVFLSQKFILQNELKSLRDINKPYPCPLICSKNPEQIECACSLNFDFFFICSYDIAKTSLAQTSAIALILNNFELAQQDI